MFAWLRRRLSADPATLAEFLTRQAAFVAQKTVYDYVRVKAGRDEDRMFRDPDFQSALRHCRWQVWFGAAADLVLVTEAWLRPAAPGREAALGTALLGLHARLHDSIEGLPPTEAEAEAAARRAFPSLLAAAQALPPIPPDRRALLADAPLFATLPIHPDQRVGETPAIRGALRFHMVSTQQEMERAFDREGLAAAIAP
jgi:hypothetical protein